MSSDLPIIPCYEDNNCENNLNCSSTLCDNQEIGKICENNPNEFEGVCWGNNPNYCEGILSVCDPNDLSINCNQLNDNFKTSGATNSNGDLLGCTISETTFPPNLKQQYDNFVSPCMEFENPTDKQLDISKICWSNGGFDIVKNLCETKIGSDKFKCKAMSYFCEWNDAENLCTLSSSRVNIPPRTNFSNKSFSICFF